MDGLAENSFLDDGGFDMALLKYEFYGSLFFFWNVLEKLWAILFNWWIKNDGKRDIGINSGQSTTDFANAGDILD